MTTISYKQIARFIVTGGLNTAVDFLILNILILLFGLEHGGKKYLFFKAISYSCAAVNSFFLNKWWVFKDKKRDRTSVKKEILSFVGVNALGLIINSGIAFGVFTVLHAILSEASPTLIANASALTGTCVVLVFNFCMYKSFVFTPEII